MKKPRPARLFHRVLASAVAFTCLAGWSLVASGCSPAGSDDGGETGPVFLAVWESDEDLGGLGGEGELFVSRSEDGGATWSSVAALNTNAGSDSSADDGASLATDGNGVWIAAWESHDLAGADMDVVFSVSTDGGATWSAPATLNSDAGTDTDVDDDVALCTDGAGTWIATWESDAGFDEEVFYSRSTDNGQTWSSGQPLTNNGVEDQNPTIAAVSSGTWVIAWEHTDSDIDIWFSRSSNGGINWSAAAPLNSDAGGDTDDDVDCQIAADGSGVCVVAWAISNGGEPDIEFSRSITGGASWSAQQPLHSFFTTDSGTDANINGNGLVTDGADHWIAVWDSDDDFQGDVGDRDILVSRSSDGGATWSAPVRLNTDGATDSFEDENPSAGVDAEGRWTVAWESDRLGSDHDIFVARSSDGGATWSAPAPLNTNASSDTGDDEDPILRGVGY